MSLRQFRKILGVGFRIFGLVGVRDTETLGFLKGAGWGGWGLVCLIWVTMMATELLESLRDDLRELLKSSYIRPSKNTPLTW